MNQNMPLPRRRFLKGLGAAIALPMLDTIATFGELTSGTLAPPKRMAFIFVPNGVCPGHWTPTGTGANFELSSILKPLAPVKNDIMVLSGLTHDKGRANGDGAGDHARSAGVFLTGAQPVKTNGSEIRLGVSVDQFAAARIGHDTRFPSLELGTEKGRQSGNCDSGYSCAYSNNISWRNEFTPMAKETNPRLVFERLFGNGQASEMKDSQAKRKLYRKSILDFVMEDARLLNKQIGGSDRMKMDEYLTAVREIELRIQSTETTDQEHQTALLAGAEKPEGIPDNYRDHIRIMADMMVLAFQTDMTRIASCMFANAGSNKSYRAIGVPDGHHTLSHHQNNPIKLEKIRKINQFHVEQLAYLLERLKSIKEGDSNLLDNCMIVYGSGINDGNRHNNENLPIILAGRGGGTLLPGRHIRFANETPLTNLFLSLLNRMNVEADYFGDSTGQLPFLNG